jgi:hypothetical protein
MFDNCDVFSVDDTDAANQRRQKQKFGPEENDIIRSAVDAHGPCKWRLVADRLVGRTARQCRERWVNYLSPDVTKAPWAADEENLLREKVAEFGPLWSRIARFFVGRTDVYLKNHYLKMLRMDRKAERKMLKQAMRFVAPAAAQSNNVDDDLEGGAFFLEDNDTGRDDWQFDSFSFVQGEFGDL